MIASDGLITAADTNDYASTHNHDWSAASLMIATPGGHDHSGLV